MSRREERLQREQKKNKNKAKVKKGIIVASSTLVGAALLATGITFVVQNVGNGETRVTAIERHVPADIDALFISEKNRSAWQYMEGLAGSTFGQEIDAADQIGVAFKKGESYLYASGEEKAMEKEMVSRGLADLPHREGVYILDGEKEGLVETGLGADENYKGAGVADATESYAYITNNHMSNFFEGASGIPADKWEWYGTFVEKDTISKNGAWVGKVSNIKSTDFNLDTLDEWIKFEKKDKWVSEVFTKENDTIWISLNPDSLAKIQEVESHSTGIDDIKVNLDKEGNMEFAFGKK